MNVDFVIDNVTGFPEYAGQQNVVATIYWTANFELDGGYSIGGGRTQLNLDGVTPETFQPIETVTKEQLVEWLIAAEGGQTWLDALKEIHTPFCQNDAFLRQQASLVMSFPTADNQLATSPVTPVVLKAVK